MLLFDVESLRIGADSFVEPHIPPIGARDQVPEPLMRQFVVMEPVIVEGIATKPVAVGDEGLVFHSEKGRLRDAVLLVTKRVGPEVLLEETEMIQDLGHQSPGLLLVRRKGEERHGDLLSADAGEDILHLDVGRDGDGHAVVVDGVGDMPMELPALVREVLHGPEGAVRSHDERLRDDDSQIHDVRLVRGLVLAGPPQVGAFALTTGGDPRKPLGGLRPGESTVPRWTAGHPGHASVVDGHGKDLALVKDTRKSHPDAPLFSLEVKRLAGRHQPGPSHLEGGIQIKDEVLQGRQDSDGCRQRSLDAVLGGKDLQAEVITRHVDGGLLRNEGPTGDVRSFALGREDGRQ